MVSDGIDEIDNKIIDILLKDGRISYSEIGENVGLSRTAVKKRITDLEKNGIIKGYTVVLDKQNSSEKMTFIAMIEAEPTSFDDVVEVLKNEKCVVNLCHVSGDSAMCAVCVAENIEELRSFAKRIRTVCPGLKKFHANSVWETFKGSII